MILHRVPVNKTGLVTDMDEKGFLSYLEPIRQLASARRPTARAD